MFTAFIFQTILKNVQINMQHHRTQNVTNSSLKHQNVSSEIQKHKTENFQFLSQILQ